MLVNFIYHIFLKALSIKLYIKVQRFQYSKYLLKNTYSFS